jgi:hypothetical protein
MSVRAFLRRERMHGHSDDYYEVQIGHEMRADDGCRIDLGPITGALWEIRLPACPDCQGRLVWAEDGYLPGTRRCTGCGSLFSVQTES